jgi:hypothetical protein
MIWLFAVISVALVTIIVELMMVYQRRAHDLKLRQEPMRGRVGALVRSMQDSTEKIRQTGAERLEDLDSEVKILRKQSEMVLSVIRKAQEDRAAVSEREIATVEEAVAAPDPEQAAPEAQDDTSRDALRDAAHRRDEIDAHVTSMRRDLEIARATLERINSRIGRRTVKKGGRRRS